MAEKEEALRIGEPKGPGEQPDGEEEEYFEEVEDEDDGTQNFPGTVTIAEQGTVQETEDGQQVYILNLIIIVCNVIFVMVNVLNCFWFLFLIICRSIRKCMYYY